jgi:hypothetical protein
VMHPPHGVATYAYSAMFIVLVRCGLLLLSSPEHHTADTVQQWRAISRQMRGRGEGVQGRDAVEQGRGILSGGGLCERTH